MIRTFPVIPLLFLAAAPAAADDVHSMPLILHPAVAPSPALKYPLLPELFHSIPGNTVTHYRRAVENMKKDAPPVRDWYQAEERWMVAPLKDFPPALVKVFAARTRLDRRLAALRCVEALRLYAAAHDGKLPAALEDVKDLPLPPDPVTGKPFDYHLAGDRAFFGCPPFPGQTATNANTPTYELSVKR